MKKICFVWVLLLLMGCSNDELKHELASLKNKHDALLAEKAEKDAAFTKVETELNELRTAAEDAQKVLEELESTKASLAEAEKDLKGKADYDAQKKKVGELQKQLKEAGKSTERLAFLGAKMRGITATVVTNQGDIKLKFFPEIAPIHCFNFITRAESGYYDKTQFHRVIPGFMIQGGDPNSRDMNFMDDGAGAPAAMIPHEFNDKNHSPGVLSMARQGNPRYGAGSQFFIMHGNSPNLNNQYTVFGEVSEGMEVVDKIAKVKRNRRDHPVEPVWVETIKIHRK